MNPIRQLNRLSALAALSLLGSPAIASAGNSLHVSPAPSVECLSYDYFDVQYIFTSFEGLDNGNGVGANLSVLLIDSLYFTASGDWSKTGLDHQDIDLYGASAGLGIYFPIDRRLHLNVEAGGLYAGSKGLEWRDGEIDNWGFFAGPGLRYSLSPGTEVFTNVHYVRFEDSDNVWEFNLGVIAAITESVAFKLAGQLNEDERSVMAGLRLYY